MSPADPIVATPDPRPVDRLAARLQPPGQRLWLEATAADAPTRAELEAYVRAAFAARHGAQVRTFMPTLLALRDPAGALRGVTGVRGAHEGRLYLEHYLDAPVEQAVAAAHGRSAIARRDIAEVGHLAGASCRAAVRLVAQLPAWLVAQRYEWIVFTATGALRTILDALGAPLVELARADGACVAGGVDDWGRYYESQPRVYAGRLRDAERLAAFVRPGP